MQTGREMMPSTMKSLIFLLLVSDAWVLGGWYVPLPTFEASNATEMIDCSHEISRKHCGDRTARVENAWSFGEFVLSVPRANDVLHARIESTLSKTWHKSVSVLNTSSARLVLTNKEAYNVELGSTVGFASAESQDGPHQLVQKSVSWHTEQKIVCKPREQEASILAVSL